MRLLSLPAMTMGLVLAATACSTSGDEGGEPSGSTGDDVPAAASEAPPAYTSPVFPDFGVPEGFSELEGEIPGKLEYESLAGAYGFDGAASDVIYVTSYLLPEAEAPENHSEMAQYVEEYNAASGNEIEDSVTTPSLVHGYQGLFRYAEVRDQEDVKAYQRNYFVFDGRLMLHLSCQWQAHMNEVKAACTDIASQLSIPAQEAEE
jgi:hypothetical protein